MFHALLTGDRDAYYMDFGRPENLADALNKIYVYDGRYSPHRRRRHGQPVGDMDRTRFVVCLQNHDQVGNQASGDRLAGLLAPEANRLACGLLLLSPCIPLLFMGEEYGETQPFPFFCSFEDPDLIEAVRRGRKAQFEHMTYERQSLVPDPQDPATYQSAKLRWQWPEGSMQARIRQLYRDLLTGAPSVVAASRSGRDHCPIDGCESGRWGAQQAARPRAGARVRRAGHRVLPILRRRRRGCLRSKPVRAS